LVHTTCVDGPSARCNRATRPVAGTDKVPVSTGTTVRFITAPQHGPCSRPSVHTTVNTAREHGWCVPTLTGVPRALNWINPSHKPSGYAHGGR